jgi:CBS-domain-containing membrane protein
MECVKLSPTYIQFEKLDNKTKNKTNSMVRVRERTIPTDRLSAKWLPTFADKGCHVVSVTDPYGRILGFLERSRYFSIK